MNWLAWLKWFGGIGALYVVSAITGVILYYVTGHTIPQPTAGGRAVIMILTLAQLVWSLWGLRLIADGERAAWIKYLQGFLTSWFLLGGILGVAIASWPDDVDTVRRILFVLFGSAWACILLIMLARLALSFNWEPLGVARAVLSEAIAMKVVVGIIGIALLAIASLPFLLNPEEPLKYQVQTFLSWSMALVSVMLSVMTILLACWTLSNEVSQKQIHMIAVKPISRGMYLLGKWIGLVTLNAVVLTVTGVAIYGFITFYLASDDALRNRTMNREDRVAVENEVLVARVSSRPEPAVPLEEGVFRELEKMIKQRPQDVLELGKDEALKEGITWAGEEMLMQLGRERAFQELKVDAWKDWRTIGPNKVETYVFSGLAPAYNTWMVRYLAWARDAEKQLEELTGKRHELSDPIEGDKLLRALAKEQPEIVSQLAPRPVNMMSLRYKIRAPSLEKVPAIMVFNDRVQAKELLINEVQIMDVPVNIIDDEGKLTLKIRIAGEAYRGSPSKPPSVTFTSKEGLEILYPVDRFTPNFIRAFLALWVKLSYLAMLGLMAATFLSFPVAVMAGFTALLITMLTPLLDDSLRAFSLGDNAVGVGLSWSIRSIAQVVIWTMTKYAAFNPREQIAEGLLFSWSELGDCFLWNGLISTGIVAVMAWLIYRRRELAKVQV